MPFFSKFACSSNRSQIKEIQVLNYSHNNLTYVPEEIILHERSLEELSLDSNRINELPRVTPFEFDFYIFRQAFMLFWFIQVVVSMLWPTRTMSV
jgi:hypothetical protein